MNRRASPADADDSETIMADCRGCAAPLSAGWKHCPRCGLDVGGPVCSLCSEPIETDWTFCAACGGRLLGSGESMPASWVGPAPRLRILHLTDVHVTETDDTRQLESSWDGPSPVRQRLAAILEREGPRVDHILITGDVTDAGSDREYERFLEVLESSGHADKVTIIPGNHELVQGSVFTAADKSIQLERFHYWCGRYLPPAACESALFPVLRWIDDRTVFIGLDTTGEGRSLYTSASGTVDAEQLERLHDLLEGIPGAVHKIIGLHHSLYPPKTRGTLINTIIERYFMYLDNAETIRQLLVKYHNVIVIHGHHHFEMFHEEPGEGRVVTLGAASSTLPDEEREQLQYVVLELHDDAVVSARQAYVDSEDGGIRCVEEPDRRRFELEDIPIPTRIAKILERPGFQRAASDRLELQRWRLTGRADETARASLQVPGFLRSAGDNIELRRSGFRGTADADL